MAHSIAGGEERSSRRKLKHKRKSHKHSSDRKHEKHQHKSSNKSSNKEEETLLTYTIIDFTAVRIVQSHVHLGIPTPIQAISTELSDHGIGMTNTMIYNTSIIIVLRVHRNIAHA